MPQRTGTGGLEPRTTAQPQLPGRVHVRRGGGPLRRPVAAGNPQPRRSRAICVTTTVTNGSVTLNVNVTFLEALAKYGVALAPSGYSSVSSTSSQVSVTYAVTGGDADVSTYSGSLTASGSIRAFDVRTKKSTEISALLFDLGDAQFDGQTATSGGEEPLVDLAGTQSGNINGTTETYLAGDLTLN